MEVSLGQRALNHYPLQDADRKDLAVWLFEQNIKGKMSRVNLHVVVYDSRCATTAVVKDGARGTGRPPL